MEKKINTEFYRLNYDKNDQLIGILNSYDNDVYKCISLKNQFTDKQLKDLSIRLFNKYMMLINNQLR